MNNPSVKPLNNFWRFYKDFISSHRTVVTWLTINILLRVVLGFWTPFATKAMIDDVLVGNKSNWKEGVWLVLGTAVIIVLMQLLIYFFNKSLYRLLVQVTQKSRAALGIKLLQLQQQFYDASQAGRLLTTAISDPAMVTNALTSGIVNALANILVIMGGYLILLYMNAWLTLAITVVFPIMVVAYYVLRARMMSVSGEIRESWGIMCGMVSEKISAVRLVRSFAAEDVETERFRDRANKHRDLNLSYNKLSALYGAFNGVSMHFGYVIVFFVGGWFYLHKMTTLGTVAAFYGYFQLLLSNVLAICNLPQIFAQTSGSLNKIFRLLDEPVTIYSPSNSKILDEPFQEVTFEKVSFRYGENMPFVIQNINLTIKAGEQVGMIGASGSGKSTLMALMLRFYDPTAGRILLNGRDIKEWELQSMRRVFGVAPQEVMLFSGTIRDNVLYTKEPVDDARVWKALEQAEASEFVKTAPGHLETLVGEKGISLSGGQKQRLSIARALLVEPQVLVLDNCTSALDASTEQRLQNTLRTVLMGRTAVIISHRISSVLQCNRVLVMDAGRIIEQGSVQELIDRRGYFADIYVKQTETQKNLLP